MRKEPERKKAPRRRIPCRSIACVLYHSQELTERHAQQQLNIEYGKRLLEIEESLERTRNLILESPEWQNPREQHKNSTTSLTPSRTLAPTAALHEHPSISYIDGPPKDTQNILKTIVQSLEHTINVVSRSLERQPCTAENPDPSITQSPEQRSPPETNPPGQQCGSSGASPPPEKALAPIVAPPDSLPKKYRPETVQFLNYILKDSSSQIIGVGHQGGPKRQKLTNKEIQEDTDTVVTGHRSSAEENAGPVVLSNTRDGAGQIPSLETLPSIEDIESGNQVSKQPRACHGAYLPLQASNSQFAFPTGHMNGKETFHNISQPLPFQNEVSTNSLAAVPFRETAQSSRPASSMNGAITFPSQLSIGHQSSAEKNAELGSGAAGRNLTQRVEAAGSAIGEVVHSIPGDDITSQKSVGNYYSERQETPSYQIECMPGSASALVERISAEGETWQGEPVGDSGATRDVLHRQTRSDTLPSIAAQTLHQFDGHRANQQNGDLLVHGTASTHMLQPIYAENPSQDMASHGFATAPRSNSPALALQGNFPTPDHAKVSGNGLVELLFPGTTQYSHLTPDQDSWGSGFYSSDVPFVDELISDYFITDQ